MDSPSSKLRLLLVDDDEDEYVLARDLLLEVDENGFDITWADNPNDALKFLQEKTFDACLFDYRLGEKSGIELLREAIAQGCRVPIILMTGQGGREIDMEAMLAGAADYLVKGKVDGFQLERAVRYAIDRKRAERALAQAEQKYRGIFENATEGILQCRPDDGRILAANPAFARFFGFESPSEMIVDAEFSFNEAAYTKPERFAEFKKAIEEHGVVTSFEAELKRKDGSLFWLSQNTRAVRDTDGKLLYYEGICEDITKRRQAEEAKMQSERLAVLGTMSAKLAHEIRNPLGSIILNLDLLGDEIEMLSKKAQGDTTESKDLLKSLVSESKRIQGICEGYLKFGKLPKLNRERVNLNDYMTKRLEFMKQLFEASKTQVAVQYDPNVPLVEIDQEQFWQAALNFIRNAMDAMSTAAEQKLSICTSRNQTGAVLSIGDTGCGMTEEQRKRLFQPFFTTKAGGTGLGLSLVQQIIAEHGGRIECDSTVGVGTTFHIHLPAVQ